MLRLEFSQILEQRRKLNVSTWNRRGEDVEENLKYFLTFGKLIGVYPSGTPADKITKAIPLLLGFIASVDLVGIIFVRPSSLRTATEIAGDFGDPVFYSLGTFIYFYIRHNFSHLCKIFMRWKQLKVYQPDVHLSRYTNLTSVCVLTSAILENATFHFKLFPVFESPETYSNKSSLEVFYERSHAHWAIYVPFSPPVSLILLITNKLALYAWNFADVLVAVLSRALYFRFAVLLQDADPETMDFRGILNDFIELTNITEMLERFLSPMIFACYGLNMYAICMQLHMWLTPSENKHILHSLYLAWSFVHLLARVLIVSVSAAKVHEEIKMFESRVQKCQDEKYRNEIQRLEFNLNAGRQSLGFTGLSCFLITKPFILSLFYVAFTFEVFLLQSDSIKVG